jgi:hypothetical protein
MGPVRMLAAQAAFLTLMMSVAFLLGFVGWDPLLASASSDWRRAVRLASFFLAISSALSLVYAGLVALPFFSFHWANRGLSRKGALDQFARGFLLFASPLLAQVCLFISTRGVRSPAGQATPSFLEAFIVYGPSALTVALVVGVYLRASRRFGGTMGGWRLNSLVLGTTWLVTGYLSWVGVIVVTAAGVSLLVASL